MAENAAAGILPAQRISDLAKAGHIVSEVPLSNDQVQPASLASIVISAFSTRDTGQPAFAASAACWKSGGVAPGTFARTFR